MMTFNIGDLIISTDEQEPEIGLIVEIREDLHHIKWYSKGKRPFLNAYPIEHLLSWIENDTTSKYGWRGILKKVKKDANP